MTITMTMKITRCYAETRLRPTHNCRRPTYDRFVHNAHIPVENLWLPLLAVNLHVRSPDACVKLAYDSESHRKLVHLHLLHASEYNESKYLRTRYSVWRRNWHYSVCLSVCLSVSVCPHTKKLSNSTDQKLREREKVSSPQNNNTAVETVSNNTK